MAKRPKALNRTTKERTNTGIKHKKNKQTAIALILMGKGTYVKFGKVGKLN